MSRPKLAVLFSENKVFPFRKRLERGKEMCAWGVESQHGGRLHLLVPCAVLPLLQGRGHSGPPRQKYRSPEVRQQRAVLASPVSRGPKCCQADPALGRVAADPVLSAEGSVVGTLWCPRVIRSQKGTPIEQDHPILPQRVSLSTWLQPQHQLHPSNQLVPRAAWGTQRTLGGAQLSLAPPVSLQPKGKKVQSPHLHNLVPLPSSSRGSDSARQDRKKEGNPEQA